MSQLPTNRTANSGVVNHVNDHSEIARLHNIADRRTAPLPSGDTSGATDAAALNAALTALASAGNGILWLGAGTYYVNATVVVPQYCTLWGMGSETSVIKQANAANLDAVVAGDSWYNNSNSSGYPISVQDTGIDGNKANQTGGAGHGLAFMNFHSVIRRNYILNCRGNGIHYSSRSRSGTDITNTSVETILEYNEIVASGGYGIMVANPSGSGTNACTDGFCNSNLIDDAGLVFINIESGAGWQVHDNHCYSITGTIGTGGMWVQTCFSTHIDSNYIEDFGGTASSGTYYGLFVGGNNDVGGTTVTNNIIKTPELGNAGSTYQALAFASNGGVCNWNISGNLIGSSKVISPTMRGIQGYGTSGGTALGTLSNNTVRTNAGAVLDVSSAIVGMQISDNTFNYATAIPTTGTWTKGTVIYNSAVSGQGSSGWVCIASGTPGTWTGLVGNDGWIPDVNTWTFVSATGSGVGAGLNTFKINGIDATGYLTTGTKISWNDATNTPGYGVIASVSFSTDTTVTMIRQSDYTMANHAITAPRYSYSEAPLGFPGLFNWNPTLSGWSSVPTLTVNQWNTDGRVIFITISQNVSGLSNNATHTAQLPVTAATAANTAWTGIGKFVDSSTVQVGEAVVSSAGTTVALHGILSTGNNTGGGTSSAVNGVQFWYPF